MTDRENFLSIVRRRGFERIPVSFMMCPLLSEKFRAYRAEHPMTLPWDCVWLDSPRVDAASAETFRALYYKDADLRKGTDIDMWGVAHEPGSSAAYHMTYRHHPMADFDSVEQIDA